MPKQSISRLFLILILVLAPGVLLLSQGIKYPPERKKVISKLPNGLYEIKEYKNDSIPLYKGTLSSVEPEIREGNFYFLDPKGRIKAIGQYKEDFPTGNWSYYDSTMRVTTFTEYDKVWDYYQKEAQNYFVDSMALSKLRKKDKINMNQDGTFSKVDRMPTFGENEPSVSFMKYMQENIVHPAYSDALDQEGMVGLEFTIDSDGFVRDPEVTKSSNPDMNLEAVRVLIESPPWEPGKQRGIAVNVRLNCTVFFKDPDKIDRLYIVEEMPRFMGMEAVNFRNFIATNLRYPEEAAEAGVSGRVIVQFTVMPDGSVAEIAVVRSIHPLLDAEAIRVVSISPKWTPGKQRGENAAVVFTYPINFVL